VLTKILQIWTLSDKKCDLVLRQMAQSAPMYSPPGNTACLLVVTSFMNDADVSPVVADVVVSLASRSKGQAQVNPHVSQAMYHLWSQEGKVTESQVTAARNCVLNGLKHEEDAVRLAAIRLAVHPTLQMHEHLVPMVSGAACDSSAAVRQLALLALG